MKRMPASAQARRNPGSRTGSRSPGGSRRPSPASRCADDVGDVEVGLERLLALADQVALVGLEAVQREAVLVGVDGDGPDAEFGGGAHHADGDLADRLATAQRALVRPRRPAQLRPPLAHRTADGLRPEDYAGKPVIAIVNTWSDANQCHTHFKQRVDDVKRGVLQAGGFPLELPAISAVARSMSSRRRCSTATSSRWRPRSCCAATRWTARC
jgi:hypothetical protein